MLRLHINLAEASMAGLQRSRLALACALQCGGRTATCRVAGKVRMLAHPITECFVDALPDSKEWLYDSHPHGQAVFLSLLTVW